MATVIGTSGNDFIHVSGDGHTPPAHYNDIPLATDGNDTILPSDGNNTVFAGGGDDIIRLNQGFTASSRFDGGSGSDKVVLSNLHALFGFPSFNVTNVENISPGWNCGQRSES